MHRWACIIATQLGADFGRTPVERHYQIYLHHQQGLLQDSPYLSISGGPLLPFQPDMGRKGCGWVGERTAGGRQEGSLGSSGKQSHPRLLLLAACTASPGWILGGGGSLSVSLPSVSLHSSNPDYPSPARLLFFLLDRAWCPCPCPPPRPPPPHPIPQSPRSPVPVCARVPVLPCPRLYRILVLG